MFTNKIYQAPSKSGTENQSVYEEIKIEICKIFIYILDLRMEFLIQNWTECFKEHFLPRFGDLVGKPQGDTLIRSVLPDQNLEAGEAFQTGKEKRASNFKNYLSLPEFKNFDQVLNRSFAEILLISIYFANSSALQDMLLDVGPSDAAPRKVLEPG